VFLPSMFSSPVTNSKVALCHTAVVIPPFMASQLVAVMGSPLDEWRGTEALNTPRAQDKNKEEKKTLSQTAHEAALKQMRCNSDLGTGFPPSVLNAGQSRVAACTPPNQFGNPKAHALTQRDHPMLRAFKMNSIEEVRAILEKDNEAATEPFWDLGFETPLFWALKLHCSADIMCLLLAHGAAPNSTDMSGRTPIQVLESHKANSQQENICGSGDQRIESMSLAGTFTDNLETEPLNFFGWGQPTVLSAQAKWCNEMSDIFLDHSGIEVD